MLNSHICYKNKIQAGKDFSLLFTLEIQIVSILLRFIK